MDFLSGTKDHTLAQERNALSVSWQNRPLMSELGDSRHARSAAANGHFSPAPAPKTDFRSRGSIRRDGPKPDVSKCSLFARRRCKSGTDRQPGELSAIGAATAFRMCLKARDTPDQSTRCFLPGIRAAPRQEALRTLRPRGSSGDVQKSTHSRRPRMPPRSDHRNPSRMQVPTRSGRGSGDRRPSAAHGA